MKQRDDFEKWVSERGGIKFPRATAEQLLARYPEDEMRAAGEYRVAWVRMAWAAWQAAQSEPIWEIVRQAALDVTVGQFVQELLYGTTPAQGAPTGVLYREALHGAAKEARVPVHILKAADDVTRYMDTYHPGNWEVAGCMRRRSLDREPPTKRREGAVQKMIALGWTWDGKQWVQRYATTAAPMHWGTSNGR